MKLKLNRSYTAAIPIVALVLIMTAITSCNSNENKKTVPTKKGVYEPKFRKDGNVWLVKKESGDTLLRLDAEYAKSAVDQNYGMMYRKSMDENMSMLFFRDRLERQSFWMQNTYVSLDIIYIDDELQVVSIQKNAEPLNTKSLPSTGPALYVLEVKGGLCDKIGFEKGDKIYFADI